MAEYRPCFVTILDADYLQAIGDVIARWAYFEVQFDTCLFGFIAIDPEARKLTKRTRAKEFKKRASLFRDAAKIGFKKFPAALARFNAIADRASQLRGDRDQIAHGQWLGPADDGYITVQTVKLENWVQRSVKNWPLSRIEKTAHEIGCLAAELHIFISASTHPSAERTHPGPERILTSDEISDIQAFRENNRQNLPKLEIPLSPPKPSRT